jgi:8-oxo-dGTP pyrophosphatase MutT (NUDIX family)
MEWFDLYNRQGEKLNKQMPRGGQNNPGEYHLVVHIWIRNSQGAYLIQQRNKTTDRIPYNWGCTSGAVLTNETSLNGAIRETYEEIGVLLEPAELKRLKRYYIDDEVANYITDVYLVNKEIDLDALSLDKNEVRAVKLASMKDIQQMIQKETFWNYERLLERTGYFALLEKS